jgi:DNA-directed RNA polymerase specialized sigma24 family protein
MAAIKPVSDFQTLLKRCHAQIFRIAIALCGDERRAEMVVQKVLRQSQSAANRWETDLDSERWFLHYTVLLSRERGSQVGDDDLLVRTIDDPAMALVMKAVRQLPMQQREAFLLHHGEMLDLHQLATAMDCSTAAAANHLVAAAQSLKAQNLTDIGNFTAQLPAMLRRLAPPEDQLEQIAQRTITTQRHGLQFGF